MRALLLMMVFSSLAAFIALAAGLEKGVDLNPNGLPSMLQPQGFEQGAMISGFVGMSAELSPRFQLMEDPGLDIKELDQPATVI